MCVHVAADLKAVPMPTGLVRLIFAAAAYTMESAIAIFKHRILIRTVWQADLQIGWVRLSLVELRLQRK